MHGIRNWIETGSRTTFKSEMFETFAEEITLNTQSVLQMISGNLESRTDSMINYLQIREWTMERNIKIAENFVCVRNGKMRNDKKSVFRKHDNRNQIHLKLQ